MVGLDKFKEAFVEFSDNYVIIGGTACDIAMTGTVVRPRTTHDIDMIVVLMRQRHDESCIDDGENETAYSLRSKVLKRSGTENLKPLKT